MDKCKHVATPPCSNSSFCTSNSTSGTVSCRNMSVHYWQPPPSKVPSASTFLCQGLWVVASLSGITKWPSKPTQVRGTKASFNSRWRGRMKNRLLTITLFTPLGNVPWQQMQRMLTWIQFAKIIFCRIVSKFRDLSFHFWYLTSVITHRVVLCFSWTTRDEGGKWADPLTGETMPEKVKAVHVFRKALALSYTASVETPSLFVHWEKLHSDNLTHRKQLHWRESSLLLTASCTLLQP